MVKINTLEIENVKRIRAVQLSPSAEGLTLIGGENGQGKTSVLDAIAWALGGARFAPSSPTRDGSVVPPRMKVTLSNGLVVERRGKNSELRVTDPSGHRSGQKLLDSFVGEFALNLPRFLDASDSEKANVLLEIIGVKDRLTDLDHKIEKTYNERRAIGQIGDQKAKYAKELPYWEGVPEEPVSASELIRQQQEILARNGENQRMRDHLAVLEAKDAVLADKIRSMEEALSSARAEQAQLGAELQTARKTAEQLQDESTAELEESLKNIEATNAMIRDNLNREQAIADAEGYRARYDNLTAELDALRRQRFDLLEGADLPLPELSVEDGALTYRGKKWDCMSGSEQLIVATSIVRKVNPACGFVLLDKLEQLDGKTLEAFNDWLADQGLQAIATRVSTGSECTIIIEDGYAKPPAPAVKATQGMAWTKGAF